MGFLVAFNKIDEKTSINFVDDLLGYLDEGSFVVKNGERFYL